MTSLTPARDAALAMREKMRGAIAPEIAAGGTRKMHAELTLGFNEVIALHIADCSDQNVDARDCFRALEGAMANAVGTIVMSGSEGQEDRPRVWSGFLLNVAEKSRRALKLVEAGVEGTSISTNIDQTPVGNS